MTMKTTTYQPGQNIIDIKKKYRLKKVVKLASNENPSGPSSKALIAGKKILNSINRYPDSKSIKLRQTIKDYLSKSYLAIDNIMIGNGSNEILEFVARRFLNEKSEVLFCKHSFLVYKIISRNMRARIIESNPIMKPGPDHLSIDLDDMRSCVTNKTSVIFIANPSNPTGTALNINRISKFIESLPKRIIVVIDEAYYEYSVFQGLKSAINLLKKYPNLIITRSFSKIHALAGSRIGYGLASKKIVNDFNDYRQPFNINYVAQEMAAVSLMDKSFVNQSLRANDAGMNYLRSSFDNLDVSYLTSYTNFLTIKLGQKTKEIFNSFEHPKILKHKCRNHKGAEHARHEAIKLSSTDWFFQLDSDDKIPPYAISEIVNKISENPDAEYIYGPTKHF